MHRNDLDTYCILIYGNKFKMSSLRIFYLSDDDNIIIESLVYFILLK